MQIEGEPKHERNISWLETKDVVTVKDFSVDQRQKCLEDGSALVIENEEGGTMVHQKIGENEHEKCKIIEFAVPFQGIGCLGACGKGNKF